MSDIIGQIFAAKIAAAYREQPSRVSTRRLLIATRVKHGADTPIGHRCSNIVEMLQNRAPPTLIAKQMAGLPL